MDWLEVFWSALVIGAAIWFSDHLTGLLEPKPEYVDRESPWLQRFERGEAQRWSRK